MEQARSPHGIREWLPFVAGVLIVALVGFVSRLPLADWGVPAWIAAPLLIGGLAAAVCLMTGQNVVEGGCITLIAGVLVAVIVVERVSHSDVRPIDAVQDCAFYGSVFVAAMWVVVGVIVFGGEVRRRRRSSGDAGPGQP